MTDKLFVLLFFVIEVLIFSPIFWSLLNTPISKVSEDEDDIKSWNYTGNRE